MKGICFKEPLFHAVIERRKTQTRREITSAILLKYGINKHLTLEQINGKLLGHSPCKQGEILYLKEPYYISENCPVLYKYDWLPEYNDIVSKGKNKLFMPAKYARYFIEITGVRPERLQDISDEDCMKEGIIREFVDNEFTNIIDETNCYIYGWSKDSMNYKSPQDAYSALINKISGAGTWHADPLVGVYDFELLGKA